jgi:zinc transport system substrate-binding protein
MGTLGEPKLVVSPGSSPHGYSLRPSEAQSLQDADIVFWVSAALTPWLAETIDTLSPDATHVEMLEVPGSKTLEKRKSALFEAHDHGDEEGEEHGEGHEEGRGDDADTPHDERDPHAWLDPDNAAIWLDAIAEELSKADPEHAELYSANAESGKSELEAVKADVEATLAPVQGRSFIVFHDAYQYFETAFDFPASGAISLGDATKPGPARIQQIQDRVKQANVTCVLAEPQFNPGVVKTVLEGTDAKTSQIDPLGTYIDTGAGLYPQLLRGLAEALADCV